MQLVLRLGLAGCRRRRPCIAVPAEPALEAAGLGGEQRRRLARGVAGEAGRLDGLARRRRGAEELELGHVWRQRGRLLYGALVLDLLFLLQEVFECHSGRQLRVRERASGQAKVLAACAVSSWAGTGMLRARQARYYWILSVVRYLRKPAVNVATCIESERFSYLVASVHVGIEAKHSRSPSASISIRNYLGWLPLRTSATTHMRHCALQDTRSASQAYMHWTPWAITFPNIILNWLCTCFLGAARQTKGPGRPHDTEMYRNMKICLRFLD